MWLAGELGSIISAEFYVDDEEVLSCDKRKKIDRRVVKRFLIGHATAATDII